MLAITTFVRGARRMADIRDVESLRNYLFRKADDDNTNNPYKIARIHAYRDAFERLLASPVITTEPKCDLEVVVNEACLNCELDCVEVVRCHDCKHYTIAKNGCNGVCKEWDTSTYTWDYCSKGERKDGGENG